MAELERLQKYLARAGVGSRRHCEQLITQGRVAVNGAIMQQLGVKVDPDTDVVAVDGKQIVLRPNLVYVMLNKPAGSVTTVEEQRERATVLDVVHDPSNVFPPHHGERRKAATLKEYRLFPVGRLDLNTEGLLILTNDGELANRLTHPRYALEKEYLVLVKGRPSGEALGQLREGVELDGKLTAPAKVKLLREEDGSAWLTIIIHEGRKRQVRRMLEAVGYPVQRLSRTRVGPLRLGNLPVGRFRFLTEQEVESLRRAVGLASATPVSRRSGTADQRSKQGAIGERIGPRSAHTSKNSRRRS